FASRAGGPRPVAHRGLFFRLRQTISCNPCVFVTSGGMSMIRRNYGRVAGLFCCTLLATLVFSRPAAAQGLVSGTVTDVQGQPVEGASVSIEQEGTNRKFDMKTNK